MSNRVATIRQAAQRNDATPRGGKQQSCGAGYGNCVTAALLAWIKDPAGTRIKLMRNRKGRWHVFWESGGGRFEFYAPGRSSKTYLQNIIYAGRVRQF